MGTGSLSKAQRGDGMTDDVTDTILRTITALPKAGTPAADLTERDRLALCIAAGAQVETEMCDDGLTVRTVSPCRVMDRGDGGYIVAVGKGVTG